MKCAKGWITSVGLVLALSACTTITTGTGEGRLRGKGTAPVNFRWTSHDGGISGMMTATLGDQTFSGRFFQITEQTRAEVLTPLWSHWQHGWYDWPPWGRPWIVPHPHSFSYPTTQFITHYTGKVVASLQSVEDQTQMRCRFDMAEPMRGMGGGGDGECQLLDGRTVGAVFLTRTR